MAGKVRSGLAMADRELRRYLKSQFKHAASLGYPRMSTFARDIARGDIGLPPYEPPDPMMDVIGVFFFQRLRQIERQILSNRYLGEGTLKERARRLGISVGAYERKSDRLIERCRGYLEGCGMYVDVTRDDEPAVVAEIKRQLVA
jgi:hypothetical protein